MRNRDSIRRAPAPRPCAPALRRGASLMVAAAGLALAGCSDGPAGPGLDDGIDPLTGEARLDVVDAVLASDELRSFEAMSTRFDFGGVRASLVPLEGTDGGAFGTGKAARALGRIVSSTASRVPLISEGARGTTFVIDPGTGEYVPDPSRTGAPANGVRFILYRVDDDDQPILSEEIGYVDLVDGGDDIEPVALTLTAVAEGVTFLQYGVVADFAETEGMVQVDGFITDGVERLNFSLDVSASSSGGVETFDLDVQVALASGDLEIDATVSGLSADGSESGSVALFVRYGDESIQVDMEGDETQISAEFRVNGTLFATASGDPESPVITRPDGEPLSAAEIEVLVHIIHLAEDVFEFFGELLEPAGEIIALGFAL